MLRYTITLAPAQPHPERSMQTLRRKQGVLYLRSTGAMNCKDCGKEANNCDYWTPIFMEGWHFRCKKCHLAMQKGP